MSLDNKFHIVSSVNRILVPANYIDYIIHISDEFLKKYPYVYSDIVDYPIIRYEKPQTFKEAIINHTIDLDAFGIKLNQIKKTKYKQEQIINKPCKLLKNRYSKNFDFDSKYYQYVFNKNRKNKFKKINKKKKKIDKKKQNKNKTLFLKSRRNKYYMKQSEINYSNNTLVKCENCLKNCIEYYCYTNDYFDWNICINCELENLIFPTYIKQETENIIEYYKAVEHEEWIESQIYFMRRYDW